NGLGNRHFALGVQRRRKRLRWHMVIFTSSFGPNHIQTSHDTFQRPAANAEFGGIQSRGIHRKIERVASSSTGKGEFSQRDNRGTLSVLHDERVGPPELKVNRAANSS